MMSLTDLAVAGTFNYNNVCNNNAASSAVCSSNPSSSSSTQSNTNPISVQIGNIVKIIVEVAGIVAVVIIIISGIKYAVSAGDANKVNSAKNTLLYAIVGLIVIVATYTIVGYVVNHLKG